MADDRGKRDAIAQKRVNRNGIVVFLRRLVKEKPLGVFGGIILLLLIFVAVFASQLAPYGFNDTNMRAVMQPPSLKYLLGTDHLGRDMLSRIIFGARISIIVGLAASLIDVAVAAFIGLVSGFSGGKTDLFIQRLVDAVIIFPNLFFYLAILSVLGPGIWQVILVLGVLGGVGSSRIIRSNVMQIKNNTYVDAVRSMGARQYRILLRHVLPNVMAPLIIIFTVSMGGVILSEATLSFLGLGIPPPEPSWGGMLSGAGRRYMENAPWMAIWPGLFLSLAVFGVNMLGDAVRDLLDPRLRGGVGGLGEFGVKRAKKALGKRPAANS